MEKIITHQMAFAIAIILLNVTIKDIHLNTLEHMEPLKMIMEKEDIIIIKTIGFLLMEQSNH